MRSHALFLAGAIVAMTACSGSSDDSSPSGGAGGSAGVGAGGAGGAATCSPAGFDGQTACDKVTCSSNEYCAKEGSVLVCRPGCLTSGNCGAFLGCDFTGSTTGIGVCRVDACGSAGSGGGGNKCPAVDGAYKLTLDTTKSSTQCKQGFTGTNACSVMQSGCTVNTTCSGASFAPFTIDANGKGNTTTTVQGVAFNCAVTFSKATINYLLEFNCSANVGGTPIVCSGTGL